MFFDFAPQEAWELIYSCCTRDSTEATTPAVTILKQA